MAGWLDCQESRLSSAGLLQRYNEIMVHIPTSGKSGIESPAQQPRAAKRRQNHPAHLQPDETQKDGTATNPCLWSDLSYCPGLRSATATATASHRAASSSESVGRSWCGALGVLGVGGGSGGGSREKEEGERELHTLSALSERNLFERKSRVRSESWRCTPGDAALGAAALGRCCPRGCCPWGCCPGVLDAHQICALQLQTQHCSNKTLSHPGVTSHQVSPCHIQGSHPTWKHKLHADAMADVVWSLL